MSIDFTNSENLTEMTDATEATLHAWLKSMLQMGSATVTFTKVDGSLRVMRCTLEAKDLPPVIVKEDAKPRKETTSTKALRVFDLELKEWRSFTTKNVKRIELDIMHTGD
jgi:hypothetical protein